MEEVAIIKDSQSMAMQGRENLLNVTNVMKQAILQEIAKTLLKSHHMEGEVNLAHHLAEAKEEEMTTTTMIIMHKQLVVMITLVVGTHLVMSQTLLLVAGTILMEETMIKSL